MCGDVHGQFYDLVNIFDLNGLPSPDNPYVWIPTFRKASAKGVSVQLQLFNGDFVDRGSFCVETIFTLFGFKLLYPHHFFMSRGLSPPASSLPPGVAESAGNHESETMNQMYGFFGEVKSKYNESMAALFTEIYNLLPLCHLIDRTPLPPSR